VAGDKQLSGFYQIVLPETVGEARWLRGFFTVAFGLGLNEESICRSPLSSQKDAPESPRPSLSAITRYQKWGDLRSASFCIRPRVLPTQASIG